MGRAHVPGLTPPHQRQPPQGVIVAPNLPIELALASLISVCASSESMNPSATAWLAEAVTLATYASCVGYSLARVAASNGIYSPARNPRVTGLHGEVPK